ncbi:hypothetical protein CQW23_28710 [Capsicum baccatum]|uniref:Transposase-associated domain-containing protein n=1 Tax=Capsicum baccatum TaxID=33114 RepID=A0A2G2VHD4_CAPBA|nr:hypothetical protein CQW23_28710 [Capsicum baccatum]
MDLPRYSDEYEKGVKSSLDFAYTYGDPQGKEILCLCDKCCNVRWTRRDVVYNHLIACGFVDGYKRYVAQAGRLSEGPDEDAKKFYNLINEASQEL